MQPGQADLGLHWDVLRGPNAQMLVFLGTSTSTLVCECVSRGHTASLLTGQGMRPVRVLSVLAVSAVWCPAW